MLDLLAERRFPLSSLRALASVKSAGQKLPFGDNEVTIEAASPEALRGVDIALFSAGSGVSKDFAPAAAEHGTLVIDNSSAFRMVKDVPLTVPEVNPESLDALRAKGSRGGIIANPNCTAIMLLMAATPLRRAFGVERMVVSTYQAASGAGAKGVLELEYQSRRDLDGAAGNAVVGEGQQSMFPEPYAFNLFSHNTAIDPATGLNGEEMKVIAETRKIWGDDSVRIAVTCIRVPVRRAHAESVNITLKQPATTAQVREVLSKAPGVRVVDDREANQFPTPLKASGGDEVLVGRIRPDHGMLPTFGQSSPATKPDETPTRVFDLFICGDQLRKGAALNAVQIAELLSK